MKIYKWLLGPIVNKGIFDNKTIPENSLASFEQAIQNNCALSFSVHVISDGTVVVFSDSQLSRLTQKDGYVKNLTYKDLENYHLLNTQYTIPTLEQVLNFVNNRTPLLIEIVSTNKNVGIDEARILNILNNYTGKFAIHSRNPFTVEWFKTNAPQICRGFINTKWKDMKKDYNSAYCEEKLPCSKKEIKKACPQFTCFSADNLSKIKTFFYKNIPILAMSVSNMWQYKRAARNADNMIMEENFTI